MRIRNKNSMIALLALALLMTLPASSFSTEGSAGDGVVTWAKNFGGSKLDVFEDAIAVSDGYVAVGFSETFDNDWTAVGIRGKGGIDATIVKFDNNGAVVWATNFGGSGDDRFFSVTQAPDGYVAVGLSDRFNRDWTAMGVTEKEGVAATIVKFDNDGKAVWAKNYGWSVDDRFNDVVTVQDGFVAVGHSFLFDIVAGKIGVYATVVKYDNDGTKVWESSFGGSGNDYFNSVTSVPDGIVAVGYSDYFNKDWANAGVTGKGSVDATVVKFNNNGKVEWAKNFGGSDWDIFTSVAEASDGFIAVGRSHAFDGDWAAAGVTEKGSVDAVAVKFNSDGTVAWAKNFGGSGFDNFESVIHVSGGFVAAGYSDTFDGDWAAAGVKEKGDEDATAVKFNNDGTVEWAKNFGGSGGDQFSSAAVTESGSFVAVGYSDIFDKDWKTTGTKGKGGCDAIIAFYGGFPFIPVTDITGVPSSKTVGMDLTLSGKVVPSDATNKTISWKVKDAGGTGAKISGNKLSTVNQGTVIVTAMVMDGTAMDTDFTKDFIITATNAFVAVTDIVDVPLMATAGTPLTLSGTVIPSDATYSLITWTIKDTKSTGARISDDTLIDAKAGTLVIVATVADGAAPGIPFTKEFEVVIEDAQKDRSVSLLLLAGMAAVAIVLVVAVAIIMRGAK